LPLICRLIVAAALVGIHAGVALAQAPRCGGSNVLDQLKATNAEAHERIVAASAATENASALLWKIELPDKAPSYLFGTMHLTDERINALSPTLQAALSRARRVILEVDDISAGSFMKAFANAQQLMLLGDGRTLPQLLGESEFNKVAEILARSGMPEQLTSLFRPWVAMLMLALSDCEKQRAGQGLLPLDARLAREADRLGIGVIGLETLETQFRAMAELPEADQLEMLRAALRLYHRIDDVLETTVQLYLARQLGAIWPLQLALAEQVGVAPKVFGSAEQTLLITRNQGMRDRSIPHLAQGGMFIAVGALHLPGKHGLVALYREAGFTVTPIE
jgi:uncharacterized protein